MSPTKDIHIKSLELVNIILFGKKGSFADVIFKNMEMKSSLIILVCPKSHGKCSYNRKAEGNLRQKRGSNVVMKLEE